VRNSTSSKMVCTSLETSWPAFPSPPRYRMANASADDATAAGKEGEGRPRQGREAASKGVPPASLRRWPAHRHGGRPPLPFPFFRSFPARPLAFVPIGLRCREAVSHETEAAYEREPLPPSEDEKEGQEEKEEPADEEVVVEARWPMGRRSASCSRSGGRWWA